MEKVIDIDPQQIGRQIGRDRQALAEQIIDCQYALRSEYVAANRDKRLS